MAADHPRRQRGDGAANACAPPYTAFPGGHDRRLGAAQISQLAFRRRARSSRHGERYRDGLRATCRYLAHGWPLSADDWDTQILFFLTHGYRVIAHDRRGHGRSTQVSDGHDMDHYADDLAALTAHLDLKNATHVGHSTGGGEVARFLGRHGESRVAKAALISAVPPLMVKTAANPGGLPKEVFDGLQAQLGGQSLAILSRPAGGAFLWLQPAGRESLGGDHPELVATGHDGWRKGAI
jgi:pimeloyl-ACP methyl ester carboxylesterase